jgi:choline dehydrogenase-like flavoprotein
MKEMFDLVVVGSGAGGSPIANRFVKAGKSVLVIEKGPLLRPAEPGRRSEFRRDEVYSSGAEKVLAIPGLANSGASYYCSHVEPDINDEPHVYRGEGHEDYATIEGYTAQVVGGGTQLYGGVSLRFTPTDMQLKTFNENRRQPLKEDPDNTVPKAIRDWPIGYQGFEKYYALAEEMIGVNGAVKNQQKPFTSGDKYQKPLQPNPISEFARQGMLELGRRLGSNIEPYRAPLAVITEDHQPSGRRVPRDADGSPAPEAAKTSYVNRYGDPLGLKSNTWVSLLSPVAGEPNLTIWPNCVVTHLVSDASRVTEVHLLDPGGTPRTVRAGLIVVACSAIESVRLLKLSAALDDNFDKHIHQNPLLGRYFLTHCFGGARALMPGRYDKSKALDADWATDCCATTEFLEEHGLWAGAALYNNTSDQALPLSLFRTYGSQDLDTLWNGFMNATEMRGDGFIKFLDDEFGRGLSISFMGNQVPQFDNRIELHPTVKDKWGRPVAYIIKTWHPHDRYLMNVMAKQCGDVLRYGGDPIGRNYPVQGEGAVYMAQNALGRMANHILGGARFGADRADSVLDENCRAWEFDNLYVTDGAFMPTAGGANPTLTIQANSFRVAEHLLSRM